MGKNMIVNTLQKARLDEWIGDYSSAEKLLSEIEESNTAITYLFRKTVKERKKKIETAGKYQISESVAYREAKPALFKTENLQIDNLPEGMIDDNTPVSCWKYSATVTSKVDSDLRVEIRGYNPDGLPPKLAFDMPAQIRNWSIIDKTLKPNNEQPSLVNFFTASENPAVQLYFSVDKWGLLSGVAILDENDIGIALRHIDFLFSKVSSQLWPR
ncbi:MAG: hypothetical protein APF77_01525 [Clostridia bacterium BRH_c25]|nr:MAG: hypothetical protein APF77_01525 [Clostridia bacterium BRH_c25]